MKAKQTRQRGLITCQYWIVTAPWYDSGRMFAEMAYRKCDAVSRFMVYGGNGKTWERLRREGWRCTKATVTWPTDKPRTRK